MTESGSFSSVTDSQSSCCHSHQAHDAYTEAVPGTCVLTLNKCIAETKTHTRSSRRMTLKSRPRHDRVRSVRESQGRGRKKSVSRHNGSVRGSSSRTTPLVKGAGCYPSRPSEPRWLNAPQESMCSHAKDLAADPT